MGQDISKAFTPPPLTFRDCFVDGCVDVAKFTIYTESMNEEELFESNEFSNNNKRKCSQEESVTTSSKKARSIKKHPFLCRANDGSLHEATPEDSTRYCLYLQQPPVGRRLLKIFRRRFRIPYSVFVSMCNEIKNHELFHRWTCTDASGVPPSDIRLLFLGTLRYLGRAHMFDDACESTYISGDVHRVFFNAFLEYGSTVLYEKYVLSPLVTMDKSCIEKLFNTSALNGCYGSSDGTHIGLLSCPSWAFNNDKGFKLAVPSRNYNATVTHWRQIIGTTFGHPGTWNDKTLILFDELIRSFHDGKLMEDKEFELLELDKDGNLKTIKYSGAWFLVDNGYLDWSTTVPPMKDPLTYEEIRFSEWVESMRKDIECTFGIMKQQFNILKHGIRLHKIANSNKVWSTCCSLHNMLLFIDGLDKGWSETTQERLLLPMNIPFSMQRLNRHGDDEMIRKGTEYPQDYFNKYTINGKEWLGSYHSKFFRND